MDVIETDNEVSALLPEEIPAMFLPGAVLLPHTHMPLRIFEPRYRSMLATALRHDRMFCLAGTKPGVDEVRGPDDFHPVCGVGLVRVCLAEADGTSRLFLQGMARVEIEALVQTKPFYLIKGRHLKDSARRSDWLAPLEETRKLCRAMAPDMKERGCDLEKITHPGFFADTVAHSFLRDSEAQQQVLETAEIATRLEILVEALRAQAGL